MVHIKMFGSLRLKCGFKGTDADIKTVQEACKLIATQTGHPLKEFENCVIVLNDKQTKKLNTALKDGDELTFMSPSGGG